MSRYVKFELCEINRMQSNIVNVKGTFIIVLSNSKDQFKMNRIYLKVFYIHWIDSVWDNYTQRKMQEQESKKIKKKHNKKKQNCFKLNNKLALFHRLSNEVVGHINIFTKFTVDYERKVT